MKSAYELALEKLESRGIERPREEALSGASRDQMAEVRRQAKARLAELEILHRDKLSQLADPAARAEQEEYYRRERQRIEERRDRELAQIRNDSPTG